MEQTTVGLLGAAIGAGGAIIAQVSTSIATNLFAAKRFRWEQTQAIRRERNERKTRFADIKRETFVVFLARNAALLAVLQSPPADVTNDAEELRNKVKEITAEIQQLAEEITLLGIAIGTECVMLYKKGLKAAVAVIREAAPGLGANLGDAHGLAGVSADQAVAAYEEAIIDCRLTMATHLSGEADD